MKHYKIEKEQEKVISNCNTILKEDKNKLSEVVLAQTDKTNFAEFTLRKKLSESKTHKKYHSHFDGKNDTKNNRLKESASNENFLKNNKHQYVRENKFESNKEFLENYTSYVKA